MNLNVFCVKGKTLALTVVCLSVCPLHKGAVIYPEVREILFLNVININEKLRA